MLQEIEGPNFQLGKVIFPKYLFPHLPSTRLSFPQPGPCVCEVGAVTVTFFMSFRLQPSGVKGCVLGRIMNAHVVDDDMSCE